MKNRSVPQCTVISNMKLANVFLRSKEFLNQVTATRITFRLTRYFSYHSETNRKILDEYPDNIIYFLFYLYKAQYEVSQSNRLKRQCCYTFTKQLM